MWNEFRQNEKHSLTPTQKRTRHIQNEKCSRRRKTHSINCKHRANIYVDWLQALCFVCAPNRHTHPHPHPHLFMVFFCITSDSLASILSLYYLVAAFRHTTHHAASGSSFAAFRIYSCITLGRCVSVWFSPFVFSKCMWFFFVAFVPFDFLIQNAGSSSR